MRSFFFLGLVAIAAVACGGTTTDEAASADPAIAAFDDRNHAIAEHEPNDEAAQATEIPTGPNIAGRGSVSASDPDYYVTTIGPQTQDFGFESTGMLWGGGPVDLEVMLPGDNHVYQLCGAPIPGDVQGYPPTPIAVGTQITMKVSAAPGVYDQQYAFSLDGVQVDDSPQ